MRRFEVIVIGGGTAGIAASLAAAHEGARVALVERRSRLGGECTFSGCVPSKALIEAAALVQGARRAAAAGIVVEPPQVDFGAVAAARRPVLDPRGSRSCTGRRASKTRTRCWWVTRVFGVSGSCSQPGRSRSCPPASRGR